MTRRAQFPSRWRLADSARGGNSRALGSADLVAPSVPGSSLTPLLSALLPNRDHNGDLLRDLERLSRARAGVQPVFSVFAADPFIEGKRLAQRLIAQGYKRVVNWPTTAQYGAEFCAALDRVNLGPHQEYVNLRRLAGRGLSISLVVCGPEAMGEAAALKPEILFLAPTFDLWSGGRIRTAELLRRCRALVRTMRGEFPVVLMSAQGSTSLAEARRAGASALLLV